MAEWIRVDDGSGERWHQLAAAKPAKVRLETSCGLMVHMDAIMDRRPEAPKRVRCPECVAKTAAIAKSRTDMTAAGDDSPVVGG